MAPRNQASVHQGITLAGKKPSPGEAFVAIHDRPICASVILLLKIATFCPNMTKITAADHLASGCFHLFGKLGFV
jgi:hypothetical protein